jgi:hypothetical protein
MRMHAFLTLDSMCPGRRDVRFCNEDQDRAENFFAGARPIIAIDRG